jgi:tRNA pseudouridine55 synthase
VFGLLNVHKPAGPTSHDIVAAVRAGTGERRIGHAGTLDPAASGVLLLALGQATRLAEYLTASEKTYRAEIRLGTSTDTYDAEGTVIAERSLPGDLTESSVRALLERYTGEIAQTPPVFSAKKVGGKAAYARVRSGEQVTLSPRLVTIFENHLVRFALPDLVLDVRCSAGTYIRSLAHDLGEALGCGAVLTGLVRTASGDFRLADAVSWPDLQASFADLSWSQYILPPDLAIADCPRVDLGEIDLDRVMRGNTIKTPQVLAGLARAYSPDGRFVAILEGIPARNQWQPRKVFHLSG